MNVGVIIHTSLINAYNLPRLVLSHDYLPCCTQKLVTLRGLLCNAFVSDRKMCEGLQKHGKRDFDISYFAQLVLYLVEVQSRFSRDYPLKIVEVISFQDVFTTARTSKRVNRLAIVTIGC
jgi:hypothetical protein